MPESISHPFLHKQQGLLHGTLYLGYPQTNMVSSAKIANANIYPADYYWVTPQIKPAN